MGKPLTEQVCVDFVAICKRAVGPLGRTGVFRWIERDELMSVGYLALAALAIVPEEALAVIVARRAMIGAIRKNERRNRGRVDDPLELLMSSGGHRICPERAHLDLWEAMKALPARQYRAVMLTYWGGLSEAAVAVEMGISQPAVHYLLKKAQTNIRAGVIISDPQAITTMRGTDTQADGSFGPHEAE
ncbi:MAG: sigma-70 family RNA polymerase sigma factor [Bryobacteraceae bacterium]|jgi:RNA polymerase sigma factor (sigma-70 family)